MTDAQKKFAKVSEFFDQLSPNHHPNHPPNVDDLDWEIIKRKYLPSVVSPKTLEQNNYSCEEQLASLQFLTPERAPNHAAILCFHPDPRRYMPGAYIQFLRINGTDLSEPGADHMEMNGSIFYQLQQMKDKIKAHNWISYVIGGGRQESADYPHAAIEQAVCNAVMHRQYNHTNAPARCYWFSDRIEIRSPGGCFGKASNENFGKDNQTVDYRNPAVSDALKNMKFANKLGTGISAIKHAMSNNGNPAPIFTADDNGTLVTLPSKPRRN